ncbi:MAG: hypothetical protein RI565_09385 [Schleiferiaceae bacterium]|nr:hypothetical protein [Schleiferiaceae bacterium]
MKKFIFLSLFLFLNVFLSCNKIGSCPDVDPFFKVTGMRSVQQEGYSILSAGDTTYLEDLLVLHDLSADYYSEASSTPLDGGALHALSCVPHGHDGAKEGIAELTVITLRDFNATYQAGDTITPALEFASGWGARSFNDFVDHSTFLDNNAQRLLHQYFGFRMKATPQRDFQITEFKTHLRLTNGDTFQCTTFFPVTVRR